jgi:UTP--glucose-1-phosphate uridylyltransferase
MSVKFAVIPAAGLGSRFLPATKAIPKELIPLVDKPLIQYVVEEAFEAGIETIVLITHAAKSALENHFDTQYELETELEQRNKLALLGIAKNTLPAGMKIVSVRQGKALGLGHAVACAAPVVQDNPFAVLLPDVICYHQQQNATAQLVADYAIHRSSVVALQEVPLSDVHKYGIAAVSEAHRITGLVEKPSPEDAPSRLSVLGRYLFTSHIFTELAQTQRGVGGEIQLTDAMQSLLAHETMRAAVFAGEVHDCGDKLGYLAAILTFAKRHPQLGEAFSQLLNTRFLAYNDHTPRS